MNEPADRPMTVEQLADYLQVEVGVIYRAVSQRTPPDRRLVGRKVGRSWRFTRAAVDQWLNRGGLPDDA